MQNSLELGRKLRIFIAENNIMKKDFAVAIGVSEVTVSNWLHHGKKPNRKNALAIVEYTKGVITLKDMNHELD